MTQVATKKRAATHHPPDARIAGVNAQSTISTGEVAPQDRLATWGEMLWRQFGSLQSEAYGDPHFNGRVDFGSMADLRICRIDASRHMVIRTRSQVRRDGRGDLKVVAQLEGTACFEQDGRRVVLRPGDWSVYDTDKPYVVTNPAQVTHMVMLLPRERLREMRVPIEAVTVRRFCGRTGASRRAFELLAGSFDEPVDIDAMQAGAAADRLAAWIELAMLERAGVATDRSLREGARDRVLAYVDVHLRDPQMGLGRVAEALGCCKRRLHKLFHDEAETLGEYIWQTRLARIREDLAAPALRARSITEIAFSWGFNSSPHFSRLFKQRYGVSPRGYRALSVKTSAG